LRSHYQSNFLQIILSSRFISLSGLSGVLAGVYALIGAFLAKMQIDNQFLTSSSTYSSTTEFLRGTSSPKDLILNLFFIALGTLILAVLTGIILTYRKSKKSNEKMWDVSSKRLLVNFFIPLFTGGAFCLVLLQNNIFGLVAPATLIFYGLACVNAAKYTFGDVRYLGITNIVIGLIATQFVGFGLYFWALGFGVLHIFYGTLMHIKYDRK